MLDCYETVEKGVDHLQDLFEKGLDPNTIDYMVDDRPNPGPFGHRHKSGYSLLGAACRQCNGEAVVLLLSYGANPHVIGHVDNHAWGTDFFSPRDVLDIQVKGLERQINDPENFFETVFHKKVANPQRDLEIAGLIAQALDKAHKTSMGLQPIAP